MRRKDENEGGMSMHNSSKRNRLMLVSFPDVKSFQLQMEENTMKWGMIESFVRNRKHTRPFKI